MVFLDHDAVMGDPNAWVATCGQIDVMRSLLRPRGIKLVLVTVVATGSAELPEDRSAPLRRRAEVDARCVVPLALDDLPAGLRKLGKALHEISVGFYCEEGARARFGRYSQRLRRADKSPSPRATVHPLARSCGQGYESRCSGSQSPVRERLAK